jgi:LDH2 family malate/lactate/ureidoglycolate dehydrogenase
MADPTRWRKFWRKTRESGPLPALRLALAHVVPQRWLRVRGPDRIVSAEVLSDQLAKVLRAWGMSEDHVAITVEIMLYADLRGIDTHGISMLPAYQVWQAEGRITVTPEIGVVRQTPATALVDGGGGLGHVPAHTAMDLAIEKCRATGVGAVAVRNSAHYGAAGAYAVMAAQAGLIGLVTSATAAPSIVPTFGLEAMLGTNPLAFAAPAAGQPPFVLDMATSAVSLGKLTLRKRAGRKIPRGWAVDGRGRRVTNPWRAAGLTPLGGSRGSGGHKGYGLAAMVEILSTLLPGAIYGKTRDARHPDEERIGLGHFFLALDPAAFREKGAFESDLDRLIETLRATQPLDPAQPVLVAGDSECATHAERKGSGIPLSAALVEELREVGRASGGHFRLDDD